MKTVVITGSTRGIGFGMAREFLKRDYRVVISSRGRGQVEEKVTAFGAEFSRERIYGLACNVSDSSELQALWDSAREKFGVVDIWINNAGINTPESFLKISRKNWDLVMAVNLESAFLCCKAVLPEMVERKAGNIINVSSVLAKKIQYSIAYGTTKAAIERFTLGLAKEMKKHNVSVNALCPDFTVTEAVTTFLSGVDTTTWQRPEMWGKYAARVAGKDAQSLTGRILDEAALRELFGAV